MYRKLAASSGLFVLVLVSCKLGSCDESSLAIPKLSEGSSAKVLNQFYRSVGALYNDVMETEDETDIQTIRRAAEELRNCNFSDPDALAFLSQSQLREQVENMLLQLDALGMSSDQLKRELSRNPNSYRHFQLYSAKARMDDFRLQETQSLEASLARLDAAAEFLRLVSEQTTNSQVQAEATTFVDLIEKRLKPDTIDAHNGRLSVIGKQIDLPELTTASFLREHPDYGDLLIGRVVLLDFWALWCGPCIEALPKLGTLQSDFGQDELVVLPVIQRDKELGPTEQISKALEVLAKAKFDGACILDDGTIFNTYRVFALPHYVIIDRDLVVRHVHTGRRAGYTTLRTEVAKLVDEADVKAARTKE